MTKKQILNRIINFILVLATAFTAVVLYSRWLKHDPRQGTQAPTFTASNLSGVKVQLPPHDGKPVVMIFWATWCGPCKVELARMKSAVKNGELPANRIYAVSLGERLEDVKAEAKFRDYPFEVFADESGAASTAYDVRVTPSIFNLDASGKIDWVAQGIHPFAVRYARNLFSK